MTEQENEQESMSVSKALTELKMLDKRIERKIGQALFLDVRKLSEDTTISRLSVKDADERIKSDLQSVNAIIERRNSIKMAIVNSNAITIVAVGNKNYTVAAAIERKNSIEYDRLLVKQMMHNITTAKRKCDALNNEVEDKLTMLLGEQMRSDKDKSKSTIEFIEQYRKLNGYDLLDPLGIETIANKMVTDIEDFELNVDVALTESNAITRIVI
ncbi:MAG: hypothetical protein ACTSWQ_06700 [Candidatus Thorarchaeota archaeon]